jgi:virginiamycin B lyase
MQLFAAMILSRLKLGGVSIAALAVTLALTAPAGAVTITEFEVQSGAVPGSHAPRYIKAGPGGLWFTDGGTKAGLGRVSTDGEFLPFIDEAKAPLDLTIASDGTVYWTAANGTGRRLPNGETAFKSWTIDTYAIALNAAGELRWGEGRSGEASASICRTENNVWSGSRECSSLKGPEKTRVTGLVVAPGGGMWSAWYQLDLVVPTEIDGFTLKTPIAVPENSGPARLAVGSDGNVWVTMFDADAIDRFLPDGTRKRFPLPAGTEPNDIAAGPDGALWYTAFGTNRIGRIGTDGVVTEHPIPTPNSQPLGITTGPDGNLWFTESASGKIGRLIPDPVAKPISGAAPAGGADTVAPRFTAAPSFSPKRFAVAGNRNAPKGVAKGSKLKLALSETADVTATISKSLPGRRSGSRCVAPGKAKPDARKCTRSVVQGSLSARLGPGGAQIPFNGKLRGKSLPPGAYVATVVAKDAAGNASAVSTAGFAVVG